MKREMAKAMRAFATNQQTPERAVKRAWLRLSHKERGKLRARIDHVRKREAP